MRVNHWWWNWWLIDERATWIRSNWNWNARELWLIEIATWNRVTVLPKRCSSPTRTNGSTSCCRWRCSTATARTSASSTANASKSFPNRPRRSSRSKTPIVSIFTPPSIYFRFYILKGIDVQVDVSFLSVQYASPVGRRWRFSTVFDRKRSARATSTWTTTTSTPVQPNGEPSLSTCVIHSLIITRR